MRSINSPKRCTGERKSCSFHQVRSSGISIMLRPLTRLYKKPLSTGQKNDERVESIVEKGFHEK